MATACFLLALCAAPVTKAQQQGGSSNATAATAAGEYLAAHKQACAAVGEYLAAHKQACAAVGVAPLQWGAFADLARERDGADLASVAAKTMARTLRRWPRRRWRVRGPGEGEGWRGPGVGGREDDGADLASAATKTVARSRTWRGRGMAQTWRRWPRR